MGKKLGWLLIGILIIIWTGFSVGIYFVSHKPFLIQVADQIAYSAWTLIVTILLTINAFMLGNLTLRRLFPNILPNTPSLLLAGGIGLGWLGILGFGMALIGATHAAILLGTQVLILLFAYQRGKVVETLDQIRELSNEIKESKTKIPAWMVWFVCIAFVLTALRTYLPPADAFDALFYHLRIPELWLADGGLQAYNIPHYWFPGIVEGVYFWGLGMGSELVSQQIHFIWSLLLTLLIWCWVKQLWGDLTAAWSVVLITSIPSTLLLASWAYTDIALTFYGAAMLYCLWAGIEKDDKSWWAVSAIAVGMAMGVKYTSVVMPISAVIIITVWTYRSPREWIRRIAHFCLIGFVTGAIWYIRNWYWMGNPFYPFVFGGTYWDSFRAQAFSGAGTGIGWDWKAILLLPITITLGYQDINSIDADIGPLLLPALPLAVFVMYRIKTYEAAKQKALVALGIFIITSLSFWVYGYISSQGLWQARLLMPAMIPCTIPMAVGVTLIRKIDFEKFRISFIIYGLLIASAAINLINLGLGTIARNPFALATGIITRESYLETYQPGYASALQMISHLPEDVSVYFLFEPRSYGMTRRVQPDPILDNFSHDIFLYQEPQAILKAWQREGYTHILLNTQGADFIFENKPDQKAELQALTSLLSDPVASSPTGYILYKISGQGFLQHWFFVGLRP